MKANIIDMEKHKTWGNNIYFLDYKKRRVTGHMTPKPCVGDKLKLEMTPKYGDREFKFFTIIHREDFSDPRDQFICDVLDSGYQFERGGVATIFHAKEKCPLCRKKLGRKFAKIEQHIVTSHKEWFETKESDNEQSCSAGNS